MGSNTRRTSSSGPPRCPLRTAPCPRRRSPTVRRRSSCPRSRGSPHSPCRPCGRTSRRTGVIDRRPSVPPSHQEAGHLAGERAHDAEHDHDRHRHLPSGRIHAGDGEDHVPRDQHAEERGRLQEHRSRHDRVSERREGGPQPVDDLGHDRRHGDQERSSSAVVAMPRWSARDVSPDHSTRATTASNGPYVRVVVVDMAK